jgi:hypothetical protein
MSLGSIGDRFISLPRTIPLQDYKIDGVSGVLYNHCRRYSAYSGMAIRDYYPLVKTGTS